MFSSISLGTILTVIKGLLTISNKITTYMQRKQLIDAGKAEAQKEALQEANNAMDKAIRASRRAQSELDDGGVPSDYKYYRD